MCVGHVHMYDMRWLFSLSMYVSVVLAIAYNVCNMAHMPMLNTWVCK